MGNHLDELDHPVSLMDMPPLLDEVVVEVTVGDLHANVMKLLYVLVRVGVIAITHDLYHAFRNIYLSKQALTQDNLRDYVNLVEYGLTKVNTTRVVRLLGDVFADRGRNDYLMLVLLCHLQKKGVRFKFIYGNHDHVFVNLFEGRTLQTLPQNVPFASQLQGQSYRELQASIVNGALAFDEIKAMIKGMYASSLYLFDYDDSRSQFILFSHAPVEVETLDAIMEQWGLAGSTASLDELVAAIDDINQHVRTRFNEGTLASLFLPGSPAELALWQREPDLFRMAGDVDPRANYEITFVHGHDRQCDPSLIAPNVIRLDNLIGKVGLTNPNNETQIAFLSTVLKE